MKLSCYISERASADYARAQRRESTLIEVGKPLVELFGYDESDDAVSQELQSLVCRKTT